MIIPFSSNISGCIGTNVEFLSMTYSLTKYPIVPPTSKNNTEIIDANGGTVFPSYCDSHTHLVFATSRESEFVDRINGLSYEEIAKKGGGILKASWWVPWEEEDLPEELKERPDVQEHREKVMNVWEGNK